AERVGVVPRQEVIDVDRHTAARRELSTLHREEFARHHVVRKLQRRAAPAADLSAIAVAEQDRGPDRGVKDDVVLAHEIEVPRRRLLPPVTPGLWTARHPSPLGRPPPPADPPV